MISGKQHLDPSAVRLVAPLNSVLKRLLGGIGLMRVVLLFARLLPEQRAAPCLCKKRTRIPEMLNELVT